MDVQTPYALDLTSLLFTAFTVGFTPLLLVGILFRLAVHPITLLYNWLMDKPKPPPPLLTPSIPASSPARPGTPRSPASSSSSARLPRACVPTLRLPPPEHPSPASSSSEASAHSRSRPRRRYSPTLRAHAFIGTDNFLSINYVPPGFSESFDVGTHSHPHMHVHPHMHPHTHTHDAPGLGLADKTSRYQPSLRHVPGEQAYRPETVDSIAAAQAHASAQPLALDRKPHLHDDDRRDRTERWRREVTEDDLEHRHVHWPDSLPSDRHQPVPNPLRCTH